jgi:hypothetical protein
MSVQRRGKDQKGSRSLRPYISNWQSWVSYTKQLVFQLVLQLGGAVALGQPPLHPCLGGVPA